MLRARGKRNSLIRRRANCTSDTAITREQEVWESDHGRAKNAIFLVNCTKHRSVHNWEHLPTWSKPVQIQHGAASDTEAGTNDIAPGRSTSVVNTWLIERAVRDKAKIHILGALHTEATLRYKLCHCREPWVNFEDLGMRQNLATGAFSLFASIWKDEPHGLHRHAASASSEVVGLVFPGCTRHVYPNHVVFCTSLFMTDKHWHVWLPATHCYLLNQSQKIPRKPHCLHFSLVAWF